jgi:hypothetical protein
MFRKPNAQAKAAATYEREYANAADPKATPAQRAEAAERRDQAAREYHSH